MIEIYFFPLFFSYWLHKIFNLFNVFDWVFPVFLAVIFSLSPLRYYKIWQNLVAMTAKKEKKTDRMEKCTSKKNERKRNELTLAKKKCTYIYMNVFIWFLSPIIYSLSIHKFPNRISIMNYEVVHCAAQNKHAQIPSFIHFEWRFICVQCILYIHIYI